MTTYVLVPGAWLGGWVWRDVAARLPGHQVHAVTLTGLGDRVHLATPQVDLSTHVADVVGAVRGNGLDDVVLVGHSYAGVVVTAAAARLADRLRALVYVDTGPLPPGMAMIDFMGPEERAGLQAAVDQHGDGWQLPFPGPDLGDSGSTYGLDQDALALMDRLATAHPYATWTQPVDDAPGAVDYPRHAILCTRDFLSEAKVRELAAEGVPGFASMVEPGWSFSEIDTGHWPMLSTPDELAGALAGL